MDIEVNYRNKKRYNTAKTPLRQNLFWKSLIWLLSKIVLMGKKYKVEKVNMEGLKAPYILLSNHMHFIDFELVAMGTWPAPVNNVVNIDGYYMMPYLLEWIGAICTRKFTMDLGLVRSINKVLKRGDVLGMYPEARYSPCGTTSYLPDSLGKLIKMNKVPVVVAIHHGNHLYAPFWNFRKKRKVPLYTTLTQVLTAEQVKALSAEEINAIIREAFQYDDYRYQKENGIRIREKYRAEGLHKVLYQCPHCLTESQMDTQGAELFCKACGKRWFWEETGELRAQDGETEFDHIPDWFEWERQQVRTRVEAGEYSFEDEVEVYSMPRQWTFFPLGKARLTHDAENGLQLTGFYRGKEYYIHRRPEQSNSLHIEYDCGKIKPLDCVDVSTENDTFYCFPVNRRDVVTKMAFATEEIYRMAMERKKASV